MTENRKSTGRKLIRHLLFVVAGIGLIAAVGLSFWLFRLDNDIKTRFAEKRFAPPVEFYSAPESIQPGSMFSPGYLVNLFKRRNFRQRDFGQPVQPGDYSVWTREQCLSIIGSAIETPPPPPPVSIPAQPVDAASQTSIVTQPIANAPPSVSSCLAYRSPSLATQTTEGSVDIIAIDAQSHVRGVFSGANPQPVASVEIGPEMFAQYYGDKPVLREVVALGTVPTNCLNGLLAIEDSKFLEHSGVSVTGLLRAMLTVIKPGKRAQGGSTITQQLVKNYFLTDERTLKRKLTEIPMAFLVEHHATKDEILETYINLIYMGQNGTFQVRGLASASQHYFGKPIADLDLPQCSLLVGLLNNPGLFNPFHAPDKALKRRAMVIDRMLELKMIDADQAKEAKASPLPNRPERSLTEPAPYFVQAVRRELTVRGIDESQGLKVYTTLNLRAQETAHQAIRAGLDQLETTKPALKKLKAEGKNLEAVLVSANPQTGAVEALVGGRGYVITQFNRATDSRRQVGSVMKPFVYLTAFESRTADGKPYTPVTTIPDKATTLKFEGQTWSPHNFENEFNGDIPIYWALKESINAATVNLGMDVGLDNIIDMAKRLGVTSAIQPLPSLTLGAFELSPMEVLQAYSAMSLMGQKTELTLIHSVENLAQKELYKQTPKLSAVVAPESTAELVGVMKQTIMNGTGHGARVLGFMNPAAGKTGTTNDRKDSWFAGFTPYHTAVVWVGYDDNTSHGLTGATGAVPIWANYMKNYATSFPPDDFKWPDGVEKITLSPEQQFSYGAPSKTPEKLENIELVFKKGQFPPH